MTLLRAAVPAVTQRRGTAAACPYHTRLLPAQNVTGVGTQASLYQASYLQQPAAKDDSFVPLPTQSQAFCGAATVDVLGNAIMWGGDDECNTCVYRTQAEAQAGIPYPNGYYDIRQYVPGNVAGGLTVVARMYDVNSVTGQPNGARDCCIQLPTDPVPINSSCTPDANCGPRCAAALRCYPPDPWLLRRLGYPSWCARAGNDPALESQSTLLQLHSLVLMEAACAWSSVCVLPISSRSRRSAEAQAGGLALQVVPHDCDAPHWQPAGGGGHHGREWGAQPHDDQPHLADIQPGHHGADL